MGEADLEPCWYDREHWPYQADRRLIDQYARFFHSVPWQLFVTLTFAWSVSDAQALKVFQTFIGSLEKATFSPIAYVRGDEKRFSGCGKPAAPLHYHLVMASAAQLPPSLLSNVWMQLAGRRSEGVSAYVQPYDPALPGVNYILKRFLLPDGDWNPRNLDLYLSSQTINKRARRRMRRQQEREKRVSLVKTAGV